MVRFLAHIRTNEGPTPGRSYVEKNPLIPPFNPNPECRHALGRTGLATFTTACPLYTLLYWKVRACPPSPQQRELVGILPGPFELTLRSMAKKKTHVDAFNAINESTNPLCATKEGSLMIGIDLNGINPQKRTFGFVIMSSSDRN